MPPVPPPALPAPAPEPVPIASQDRDAWVARFLGDKGPIQIGSRAEVDPMPREGPEPATGAKAPPKPGRPASKAGARAPRRPSRGPGQAIAAAALVGVGLVAFVFMLVRAGAIARGGGKSGATRATYAPARPMSQAPETRPRRARVRSSAVSDSASYGVEAVASGRGPFSIDVGGANDLQSALMERDRVQALTGIQTWVATAPTGDGQAYRIVVGAFRSRDRAEAAARMLLRSQTLGTATVVPLPRASERE
jgi:hypothetical protein